MKEWFVYILECGDGTLYTGISNDVEARVKTHNSGQGASYTRSRIPVKLVFKEKCQDHSTALKREFQIKKYDKKKKLDLITNCR